ncbi:hypothetical protein [Deinococcus aluminii]|uniref:DUF1453 domain-containing protein n=1 Tax=Deinococcus aluminii TaxID=1656885 RepID=A0ABP9XDM4_9DEIO
MNLTELLVSLALIGLVVRQLRGRPLTVLGLLWPVALVLIAGAEYVHSLPDAGHGLGFVLGCGGIGAVLGVLSGSLTHVSRRRDGTLIARATGLAALLWVLGVGARLGFALYAQNGGGPAIAHVSAAYHLTEAAWTDGLMLMALAEVLGRTAALLWRSRHPSASPLPA